MLLEEQGASVLDQMPAVVKGCKLRCIPVCVVWSSVCSHNWGYCYCEGDGVSVRKNGKLTTPTGPPHKTQHTHTHTPATIRRQQFCMLLTASCPMLHPPTLHTTGSTPHHMAWLHLRGGGGVKYPLLNYQTTLHSSHAIGLYPAQPPSSVWVHYCTR